MRDRGIDDRTWTDHTDIVPTMNALLGLHPDYTPDGRVITQDLTTPAAGRDVSAQLFHHGQVLLERAEGLTS